jgi:hypothetical protein
VTERPDESPPENVLQLSDPDALQALRRQIQRQVQQPAEAFTIDGRTFSFEAPITSELAVGGFVGLETEAGVEYLGQVSSLEAAEREGPRLTIELDDLRHVRPAADEPDRDRDPEHREGQDQARGDDDRQRDGERAGLVAHEAVGAAGADGTALIELGHRPCDGRLDDGEREQGEQQPDPEHDREHERVRLVDRLDCAGEPGQPEEDRLHRGSECHDRDEGQSDPGEHPEPGAVHAT